MNTYPKKSSHKLDTEARSLLVKAEIAKQCIIPETVQLGIIRATPAAIEVLGEDKIFELVRRHEYKDYGDLDKHDIYANELALICGNQVISLYHVDHDIVYVVTEADRSHTIVFLAYEY